MKLRYSIAILAALAAVLCGCVTSPKVFDRKPTAANFDRLPLCARIKYVYTKAETDETFKQTAVIEARAMYEAVELLARDARSNNGELRCKATGIKDLIVKPAWCKDWSGPYINEELIAKYGSMFDEDFQAFVQCWK